MKHFSIFSRKGIGRIILLLLFIGATFVAGLEIPWKDQWTQYQSVRNISGIVFAAVGVWMAIIYSSGLNNSKFDRGARRKIKLLHTAMSRSGVIIIVVSGVEWTVPAVKSWAGLIPDSMLNYFKLAIQGTSYALLSILLVIQAWNICVSLIPNYNAISDLRPGKDET